MNPFSELILSNAYGILPILVFLSSEKFCVIVPVQVKLPVLFAPNIILLVVPPLAYQRNEPLDLL
jgi:hypothetical protein